MMKKALYLISSLLVGTLATAQNEVDALRYSQTELMGTARYTGMAGAFGALGGDASTISSNPGGLGVFRKSELSFSTAFRYSISDVGHLGTSNTDNEPNFHVPNFAAIFSWSVGSGSKWKAVNLGLGSNRLYNFSQRRVAVGTNLESSLADVWANDLNANNVAPDNIGDPFGAQLAWNLYLVDTIGTSYYTPIGAAGVNQRNQFTSEGAHTENFISLGANYDDRLYLGGTIGLTRIRYQQNITHSESSQPDDFTTDLIEFSYGENLVTEGSGYNLKLGFIYRFDNNLRVGGAFHTPTLYFMDDTWDSQLSVSYTDGFSQSALSPIGTYSYRLRTPMRAIGSLAYVFKKNGLISVDYEFVDYSTSNLSSENGDYDFNIENNTITDAYRSTGNIRVGLEYRIKPLSLRAGFAHNGNPYSSDFSTDLSNQTYTAGIGIRKDGYYMDWAYAMNRKSTDYFLYDPAIVDASSLQLVSHQLTMTVGLRF